MHVLAVFLCKIKHEVISINFVQFGLYDDYFMALVYMIQVFVNVLIVEFDLTRFDCNNYSVKCTYKYI